MAWRSTVDSILSNVESDLDGTGSGRPRYGASSGYGGAYASPRPRVAEVDAGARTPMSQAPLGLSALDGPSRYGSRYGDPPDGLAHATVSVGSQGYSMRPAATPARSSVAAWEPPGTHQSARPRKHTNGSSRAVGRPRSARSSRPRSSPAPVVDAAVVDDLQRRWVWSRVCCADRHV